MPKSIRPAPQAVPEDLPAAPPGSHPLREPLEDVPMLRYAHPIPQCCREEGPYRPQEHADLTPILEALERQNALLTELLGAVTGLTAACLCRQRQAP